MFSLLHVSATELQSNQVVDPGLGESRDAPRCLLGSQFMEGTQRGTLWIPLFGWAVARVSETTQARGAHPGGAFLAWLRTGSGVLP